MSGAAPLSVLWCEYAAVGESVAAGVSVTVADGAIVAVEAGAAAPAGAIRLAGLTVPGIANAHSHAFHRALRGRTHTGGGSFWTWRERMYELAACLDPDTYEQLATATFSEMVLAGYTAVGEFHYLHHQRDGTTYSDPNEIGRRLATAAASAGIRLTLLDACYLSGGFGAPLDGVQRRFGDATVDAWGERVDALCDLDGATTRVGAAIHSVRAVDPAAAETIAEWAAAGDRAVHAHVSEQSRENDECLAARGCTPVESLDRSGALGEGFTAVHATHLTGSDIATLGGARCSCCVCPTTERELADGIGPTGALAAAGARLCVGSDSHAVIDPCEELRAIELDERLATRQRGSHQPAALLRAGTANGYRAIGWGDGGRIAAGALADLVTFGLDSQRLAGAGRDDLVGAVVFAATSADVTDVFVGGRHVVAGGTHVSIDVPAALAASIDAVWSAS